MDETLKLCTKYNQCLKDVDYETIQFIEEDNDVALIRASRKREISYCVIGFHLNSIPYRLVVNSKTIAKNIQLPNKNCTIIETALISSYKYKSRAFSKMVSALNEDGQFHTMRSGLAIGVRFKYSKNIPNAVFAMQKHRNIPITIPLNPTNPNESRYSVIGNQGRYCEKTNGIFIKSPCQLIHNEFPELTSKLDHSKERKGWWFFCEPTAFHDRKWITSINY